MIQDTLWGESLQINYIYYPSTLIQLNHVASPTSNKRPIFSWISINDTSYGIEIGTSKSILTNVILSSTVYGTSFTPTEDLPNGKIYWRVYSQMIFRFTHTNQYSLIDSFTVFTNITAKHISPTANRRPMFSWTKTDSAYTLQIDTVSNKFTAQTVRTLTDTFFVPTTDLPVKTIYWRVSGITGFSAAVDSFVIYKQIALNHIQSSSNKRPTFSWTKCDTSYTLQIDTSKSFTKSLTIKDTFYTPTTDLPTKTIYWKVLSNYSTSVIDSFVVQNVVAINETKSNLIQQQHLYSLTVFNIQGRQIVKPVTSNKMMVFKHNIAGTYIAVLKVDGKISKKVIVVH
jgi:hypothetical protein